MVIAVPILVSRSNIAAEDLHGLPWQLDVLQYLAGVCEGRQ